MERPEKLREQTRETASYGKTIATLLKPICCHSKVMYCMAKQCDKRKKYNTNESC